jgi:tetratricopeptide (TPR) repeat protein
VALGRPVGAREFVAAIEEQLARQPLDASQAGVSVYATVAGVYQQLGEPARAATLLRAAIQRLPAGSARDSDLLLGELQDELASALLGISDFEGAAAANEVSAALRMRWLPQDPAMQLRTLRNHAWVDYRRGLYEVARPQLEAALALAAAHPQLLDEQIEDCIAALADIEMRAGDLEPAERHSREQLQRAEARTPAGHPDRLAAMRLHAAVLNQLGRYREAQQLLQSAIMAHEQIIGSTGARLADLENDLAVSLNDSGEAVAALPHAERALALTERDRDSPLDRALGAAEPGVDLRERRRLCGAPRRWHARASTSMRRNVAPLSRERLRAEGNLARSIGLRGGFEEARARFESVRARQIEIAGEPDWNWAFETLRQAQLERRAGRLPEAQTLLDAAEPIFVATLPPNHPGAGPTAPLARPGRTCRRPTRRSRARVRSCRGTADRRRRTCLRPRHRRRRASRRRRRPR